MSGGNVERVERVERGERGEWGESTRIMSIWGCWPVAGLLSGWYGSVIWIICGPCSDLGVRAGDGALLVGVCCVCSGEGPIWIIVGGTERLLPREVVEELDELEEVERDEGELARLPPTLMTVTGACWGPSWRLRLLLRLPSLPLRLLLLRLASSMRTTTVCC
jgi:hypothetical protein